MTTPGDQSFLEWRLPIARATTPGKNCRHYKQTTTTWRKYCKWIETPSVEEEKDDGYGYVFARLRRTDRVHEEYVKGEKTGKKFDCPNEFHRWAGAVVERQVLTLDAEPDAGEVPALLKEWGCAAALHTTFSSEPDAVRLRIGILLSRLSQPEETRILSRYVMAMVGVQYFDTSSDEPERFMYAPVTRDPDTYWSMVLEGQPLDVDQTLVEAEAYFAEHPWVGGGGGGKAKKRGGGHDAAPYDGPAYADLTPAQQQVAQSVQTQRLERWAGRFQAALSMDNDDRDKDGNGWEQLAANFAMDLADWTACPWMSMTVADAYMAWDEVLPPEIADAPESSADPDSAPLSDKLSSTRFINAAYSPAEPAPWDEAGEAFGPLDDAEDEEVEEDEADIDPEGLLGGGPATGASVGAQAVAGGAGQGAEAGSGSETLAEPDTDDLPARPTALDEAMMADWMVHRGLKTDWRWAPGMKWLKWNGRRWAPKSDEELKEAVRRQSIKIYKRAKAEGIEGRDLQAYKTLLYAKVIGNIAGLMKGAAVIQPSAFDNHPDLLNVWNGVVNLRTSELLPHDKGLFLTKITRTPYIQGARHDDWDQVLKALDPDVMDWMQIRFGQGVTGYRTPDDVMPIGQGGGSNGKSTLLGGMFTALGDHMVNVPEKLLRGNPNEHPTELMTLRGTRLAVIDETPEAGQLNVGRLKAMLGTEKITARGMRQDFMTWDATHTLMVMTNYRPNIAETDHGTWRRLALVVFDKKFPPNPMFRDRVIEGKQGRSEAALAWAVEGARRWYEDKSLLYQVPARVVEDTRTWRKTTDMVVAYLEEGRVVIDPAASVLSAELQDDFNEWMHDRGQKEWGPKTFNSRFGEHEDIKKADIFNTKAKGRSNGLVLRNGGEVENKTVVLWKGLRWAEPRDDGETVDTPEEVFAAPA